MGRAGQGHSTRKVGEEDVKSRSGWARSGKEGRSTRG